ncbi:MAG: hypothetical protein ANABAC_1488 [Anaerolineae bacterium]|nr:MAG: hypothetical protein ANABAC_1488 [Anaerolineae bacterium]
MLRSVTFNLTDELFDDTLQGQMNLLDKGALVARMHSAQWGKPVTRLIR